MATAVDWTVDKLLSSVKTLNARSDHARNTLRANRARYSEVVRQVSSIPDIAAQNAVRDRLRSWIYKQVDAENRYRSFSENFERAKSLVKQLLQSVHITPPTYLGAGPVLAVPASVAGLILTGLVVVATIIAIAVTQSKVIDNIAAAIRFARDKGLTGPETVALLKAAEPPPPDPLGLTGALKAAVPLVLVIGAVIVAGVFLKPRGASA